MARTAFYMLPTAIAMPKKFKLADLRLKRLLSNPATTFIMNILTTLLQLYKI
jgi:hypothetical protein